MGKEIWKSIDNSKYYISTLGRVKNINTGKILKQYITSNKEYKAYKIKLPIDGKRSTYIVSRLVANAFITNHENKPEVDHIDRDPLNNDFNNLRWVTRVENCNNRVMISEQVIIDIISKYKEGKSINEIKNYLG